MSKTKLIIMFILYFAAGSLFALVDWKVAVGVLLFGWAHNVEKHDTRL